MSLKIEDVLGKLHGVRQTGENRYMSCCPAHEDKNASLSISVGADGKILFKCFAGCSFENICAAIGVAEKDMMGDSRNAPAARHVVSSPAALTSAPPPRPRRSLGRFVCDYRYTDENGKELFKVNRYEPKNFAAMSYDPQNPKANKDGYVYGVTSNHVRPVLYHLPEVLAAAKAGKAVFLVEGEKDVETLRGLGVTATTSPFGAKREWLDSFTDSLKGVKAVVLVADKDPKEKGKEKFFWAGQRRAWLVGEKLIKAGIKTVRMVVPDVGIKSCKDITDWVEASGADKQALRALVAKWLDASNEECKWPAEWMFDGRHEYDGVEEAAAAPSPRPPSDGSITEVDIGRRDSFHMDGSQKLSECLNAAMATASTDDEGRGRKIESGERRRIVSAVVIAWLKLHGKFYFDADPEKTGILSDMFFYDDTKQLTKIESDVFKSWLSRESGVNWSTNDYKFLIADIHNETLQGEGKHGVFPCEYWTRKAGKIYLSCGEGMIARIEKGKIEMVPNGTDEVLFDLGKTLRPWKLLPPGKEKNPFETCSIFSKMACSANGKMLAQLWLLGLPYSHKTKPPIVFSGEIGSGKTRAAVGFMELLGLPIKNLSIGKEDKGRDDLWLSVNNGGLICLDNLDARIKWLPDALANIATDGTFAKRQLYTEKEMIYRANAAVMMTSSNAMFAADAGLADRLLVVRLDRRNAETAEASLSDEIAKNRDSAISWICRTIAKALSFSGEVPKKMNRRHPDWAEFAYRCGWAMDRADDAEKALRSAEEDKSRFNIENDYLGSLLLQTFCAPKEDWKGTSTQLVDLIKQRNEELTDSEKADLSPRKIGMRLIKLWPHLQQYFNAKKGILDGSTWYEFMGRASFQVDEVDAKGCLQPLHAEKGGVEFCENTTKDPLNPLSQLPKEEKEEEIDISETEMF